MKAQDDSQVLDDSLARGLANLPPEEARMASDRPPFPATLAAVVAAAALALAIFRPLLANLDGLRPFEVFMDLALGGLLALLGLLLGALALRARQGGRPGRRSSRRVAASPRAASVPGRLPMRRRWT